MSRLPLNVVKEMFFSADLIDAERAERVGIVNQIVPADQLQDTVYTMARDHRVVVLGCRRGQGIASGAVTGSVDRPRDLEYLHGLGADVYFGSPLRRHASLPEKRAPKF